MKSCGRDNSDDIQQQCLTGLFPERLYHELPYHGYPFGWGYPSTRITVTCVY
jgi:hypothetical protein